MENKQKSPNQKIEALKKISNNYKVFNTSFMFLTASAL